MSSARHFRPAGRFAIGAQRPANSGLSSLAQHVNTRWVASSIGATSITR